DPVRKKYFKIMKSGAAPPPSDSSSFVTSDYVKRSKIRDSTSVTEQTIDTAAAKALPSKRSKKKPTSKQFYQQRQEKPNQTLFQLLRLRHASSDIMDPVARSYWQCVASRLSPGPTLEPFVSHSCSDRISEFDIHPSKNHLICASFANLVVCSFKYGPDKESDNDQRSRSLENLELVDSVCLLENSDITEVRYANSSSSNIFVSTALGVGSRSGSMQIYSYDSNPKDNLITNCRLQYRFNPRTATVWTCAVSGSDENLRIATGASKGQLYLTTPNRSHFKTATFTLPTAGTDIFSLSFQPTFTNPLLLCGTRGGTIHAVDIRTPSRTPTFILDESAGISRNPVCDLSFHPSGSQFASLQMNGDLKIWDLRYSKKLGTADGAVCSMKLLGTVNSFTKLNVDWIGDGSVIAGVGEDGRLRAWNIKNGGEHVFGAEGKKTVAWEEERYKARCRSSLSVFQEESTDRRNGLWVSNGKSLAFWE
ncbi:DDB1- and CUL4-associated factor 4, partial [Chytriomyces hyalinus]